MDSDFKRGFVEDGTKILPEILPLLVFYTQYCYTAHLPDLKMRKCFLGNWLAS